MSRFESIPGHSILDGCTEAISPPSVGERIGKMSKSTDQPRICVSLRLPRNRLIWS